MKVCLCRCSLNPFWVVKTAVGAAAVVVVLDLQCGVRLLPSGSVPFDLACISWFRSDSLNTISDCGGGCLSFRLQLQRFYCVSVVLAVGSVNASLSSSSPISVMGLLCLESLTRKGLCCLLCIIAGSCWYVNQFVLAAGSFAVLSCEGLRNIFLLLFGFVPLRGFAGWCICCVCFCFFLTSTTFVVF
jgi:hypothetical protein